MRHIPGYKGPTLPGPTKNPNDPRLRDPRLKDPRTPVVSTRPMGAPTGGMFIPTPKGMPSPAAMDAQKAAGVGMGMKKGGKVKKMAKGGSTASKRADGIATKGKTRGRII